jgi:hypothetical protein
MKTNKVRLLLFLSMIINNGKAFQKEKYSLEEIEQDQIQIDVKLPNLEIEFNIRKENSDYQKNFAEFNNLIELRKLIFEYKMEKLFLELKSLELKKTQIGFFNQENMELAIISIYKDINIYNRELNIEIQNLNNLKNEYEISELKKQIKQLKIKQNGITYLSKDYWDIARKINILKIEINQLKINILRLENPKNKDIKLHEVENEELNIKIEEININEKKYFNIYKQINALKEQYCAIEDYKAKEKQINLLEIEGLKLIDKNHQSIQWYEKKNIELDINELERKQPPYFTIKYFYWKQEINLLEIYKSKLNGNHYDIKKYEEENIKLDIELKRKIQKLKIQELNIDEEINKLIIQQEPYGTLPYYKSKIKIHLLESTRLKLEKDNGYIQECKYEKQNNILNEKIKKCVNQLKKIEIQKEQELNTEIKIENNKNEIENCNFYKK